MPLFKVESPGYKRVLIKAENIAEIIKAATEKLNLPKDSIYKVLFLYIFYSILEQMLY